MVKLALKGESHRAAARQLVRESVATGIGLIAPPIFTSEVDTAKVFYDAVTTMLSHVKYLPDYP